MIESNHKLVVDLSNASNVGMCMYVCSILKNSGPIIFETELVNSPVTCSVESLTNGFRSPTTGYTVPEGTKITTFCNTNYSLAYTVDNKALCNASQPSCYGKL